jgi:hypothetical protein
MDNNELLEKIKLLEQELNETKEHLKKYTAPIRSKTYDKTEEEIRYDDLFMLHGGKFIFIRFNPDPFTNSLGTKKNPYMKKRMDYLKEEIDIQIERIEQEENSELLEISYLFYDNCEFNL